MLIGKKKFLKLHAVNEVNVPHFDELALKVWYPKMCRRPEISPYFPDKFAKGSALAQEEERHVLQLEKRHMHRHV